MRQVAIEALGWLGDDRSAETLRTHLADSNQLVRDAAKEALRRLGYRPVASGPVPWDTDELEQLARKPAIPPHLRWQPDQKALTPEQQAEAGRFTRERIESQLDTSLVDEPEAEALLKRVYAVAGLIPPRRIRWVDSPLQLVVALALDGEPGVRQIVWGTRKWVLARSSAGYTVVSPLTADVEYEQVATRVKEDVWMRVGSLVEKWAQEEVQASIEEFLNQPLRSRVRERVHRRVEECVGASVEGYRVASLIASYHFHGHYQSSTRLHVLAHFNELVSGYWLGREQAVLVRRPGVLARDAQGWLHSATGKCIEYRDGWGFYAWHGVRVPKQVILTPEALSREDVLNAPDLRVRRVMQERMGERFVPEP